MKKQSNLSRLMGYAGGHRILTYLSWVLSVMSALLALVPFWYIWRIMMDNIFIRTDPAGNIKADKEKSTEKIDGAVAAIMGLDRAVRCGNQTSESVYDSRGLLVF